MEFVCVLMCFLVFGFEFGRMCEFLKEMKGDRVKGDTFLFFLFVVCIFSL